MSVGRNEPCPCGSGEKYKRCCGVEQPESTDTFFRVAMYAVGIVLVIGAVAVARSFLPGEKVVTSGVMRVWSTEHGHWHVVGGGHDGTGVAAPGKVWDPEHGDWHDGPVLDRGRVKKSAAEERMGLEVERAEQQVQDEAGLP